MVIAIFQEIFSDSERFVVLDYCTGGYDWRYDSADSTDIRFREHAHGVAIDINWDFNCQYTPARSNPYEGSVNDKYTIKAGSSVVRIFKKYGWQWGGDWNSTKDYMHFQWTHS